MSAYSSLSYENQVSPPVRLNHFLGDFVFTGCQKKTAARNPNSQSKNELHENTKALQAADLVGYDGTKLRKSVDKITKDNDKHNKEIENITKDQ